MTIQGALASALSSLNLEQQQAQVIANNIANANTPGYVQRDIPRAENIAGQNGTGVLAEPIVRLSNQLLTDAANQASGSAAYSNQIVAILGQYIQTVGQPSDSTSLPSTVSAFQTDLTNLSSTPDDTTAQTQTITAAQNLTDTIHTLASAVSSARQQADQAIGTDAQSVNDALDQLATNEAALKNATTRGDSTAAYADTRDKLLSQLSQKLPIKVFQDSNNGIIVTTDQGTTLWDGTEHKLSFTATSDIPNNLISNPTAAQTADGYLSGLSGVTVDGRPIAMSQTGSIAANLQLRDVTLPQFARQLDELSANLINTFQSNDQTFSTSATPHGVFSIADGSTTGAALTGTTPIGGIASKIQVNGNVIATPTLLRDGANAAIPGNASDNSTILAFLNGMQSGQSYTTATGLPGSMSLGDAASQIAGTQQATLSTWTDRNTTRAQQSADAQTSLQGATGVNVDQQLQRLILVQQTYQASAQVLQAVSKMLDTLNTIK
ncbi:MAG TPA: flagellar hook-associated protein FlgK [Acetobacteraceae bacterium]|nr:flagellar hook-associated protein FlgK [Acetobacteraceae bacterium]